MELDSGDLGSEDGSRVSEEARVKKEVKKESDGREFGEEMEAKGSEVKVESSMAEDEVEEEEEEEEEEDEEDEDEEEGESVKRNGSQFNSLMSEFDDFVANEDGGQVATSRALQYGFEVGDMVWGKVKSHPWWPGHIFNDAFASSQVRRTRREGHILVAFFGDSSYGWFDPAEFIPFDANFAEKSRQTSSRNFSKAVDEAVDEVSRRCALGLACRCRSSQSFQPASVQGYFAVDVPDYEPRAVYSAKQIQKARDSFKPREAVSFIKNLALSPCVGDEKDLEFMKSRATVVAYRKAVFEEHDVTYAQAFGVQPGRRATDQADLPDQSKLLPRAPLSGPLVIAETLGGDKKATKEKKVKDGSKKDKYLLKRRDESSHLKKAKVSSTAAPLATVDGSAAVGDGNLLLQKIALDALSKPENISKIGGDSSTSGSEAISADKAAVHHSLASQDASIDTKPSLDKGKASVVLDGIQVSKATDSGDLSGNVTVRTEGALQSLKGEVQDSAEIKHEESQQPQPIFTAEEDGRHAATQVQDGQSAESPSQIGVKHSRKMSKISGVKKSKVKRPREEPDVDNPMPEKKKKKKNQLDAEKISGVPKKHSVSKSVGSSARKIVVKKVRTSLAPKEELKTEQSKRIVANSNNLSDSAGPLQMGSTGNEELELPLLLSDLQTLALDPFHGMERSSPTVVRKFFLRFRSLVYQKSLALSPPPDAESVEARSSKSLGNVGETDNSSTEPVKELPSTKPAKPIFRSEDPTIAGRKRSSSDFQEDIAAKRAKKVSDIKTLAAEKKITQKTPEAYRSGEGREQAVPLGRRTKPNSAKKSETARAVDPTVLVMKFPPKTSLPSLAELKLRFARFGPIDQSGLRVFWKSLTCRIVFLYKSDAQAACKYATENPSLFGMPGMRCYVKEYRAGGTEVPESGKPQGTDDNPTDTQRTKDSNSHRPQLATLQSPLPLLQPAVQLKSCLKKASADESGPVMAGIGGGNSRGTPRVKFMLAGDESTSASTSRAEPSIAGIRNNNNSASFSDGGALISSTSTTSVAMDFSVRNNIQKVVPSPLPILPTPPQFAKPTLNNSLHHHHHHHSDAMMMMGPRNAQNTTTSNMGAPPGTTTNGVDISQQLLSLLTRCNDVVTNVTGLLGYVPYHPL